MMRAIAAVAATLAVLFAAFPASAQTCTYSISNIVFSGVDVTLNQTFDTTGTLSISCTGNAARTVRVCPNIGTGTGNTTASNPRQLANGANRMNFNIFQDAGYSTIWGSHLWAYAPTPPTIDIPLAPAGAGSATRTLYARINAGQQTLTALTFTSAFTTTTHSNLRYAYTTAGTCATIGSGRRGGVAPFTVTATNNKTCRVTANDLNFGAVTAFSIASNLDVSGSATITCTNATAYRVLIGNGLTGTGPTARKMTSGANSVTYGIYRDAARTLAWGSTSGVNSLSGTGSGFAQTITMYGRVPPQTVPPPGAYKDTVVMTIEY